LAGSSSETSRMARLLFVHLAQLIGFRNRLVVLVDWAWQYLFYRPASALILDTDASDGRAEPIDFVAQET